MLSFGVNSVVIDDDQVLLTLRSDLPVWCLPGGAIEDGETLEEAAVRETKEETGADVVLSRLTGAYSRPRWLEGSNHEVVFAARQISGVLQPQDAEVIEVRYFPLNALPNNLLWWHQERIFDAFYGRDAVIRVQDVRWPLPELSYSDAQRKMSSGELAVDELIAYFCREPLREPAF